MFGFGTDNQLGVFSLPFKGHFCPARVGAQVRFLNGWLN